MPFVLLILLLAAAPVRAEVATSILPLQGWASELLGGEEVQVLVGPGQSPALFEPTGRQLTLLAEAEVFFAIGVPFETALVPRLRRMFPDLQIVELGGTLERIDWPEVSGHGDLHDLDPHVWLAPMYAVVILEEMATVLSGYAPDQAASIAQRAASMRVELEALDARLRERLAPLSGQRLLAYHPALGYFARAYGLRQVAVESGGTEPGARHLTVIAQQMREQSLRVLVVEPQFAPHRARALAGSLDLEVVVLDPLAVDLVGELERFSIALVDSNRGEDHP